MSIDLLHTLVSRSDQVSLEHGRLVITPLSGRLVPDEWLRHHHDVLVLAIARAVGIPILRYLHYSTGSYGNGYTGVTLQFLDLLIGENPYVIYNVDLKRRRNSKHGRAGGILPRGQFRTGERSEFYRFWMRSGLKPPRRLSAWHDYMGKLKLILFTAQQTNGRLDKSTLSPVTVRWQEIRDIILPNTPQTNTGQFSDNCRTTLPDKNVPQAQPYQRLQTNLTAGHLNHVDKLIRMSVDKVTSSTHKEPEHQTDSEWLADYCGEERK